MYAAPRIIPSSKPPMSSRPFASCSFRGASLHTYAQTMAPSLSPKLCEIGVHDVAFTGHIDSLSPASGAQFALLPPDNATENFTRIVQRIPVKITFDNGQQGLDQLRPGMSATVALASKARRSSGDTVAQAVAPPTKN